MLQSEDTITKPAPSPDLPGIPRLAKGLSTPLLASPGPGSQTLRLRPGPGTSRPPTPHARPPRLTIDVLPVADVLQVAARVLAAQVSVRPVGLQARVRVPAELGAGRHAARGRGPHLRRPEARAGAEGGPAAGSAAAAAARPRHGRRPRLPLASGARPDPRSPARSDFGRSAELTPPRPWRAARKARLPGCRSACGSGDGLGERFRFRPGMRGTRPAAEWGRARPWPRRAR